jgi:hypothetical protein
MSCLILGQMKALTPSQKLQYSQATSVFTRVQAYNANIVSLRGAGNTEVSYYVFRDNAEKTFLKEGLYILTQNDPAGVAAGRYTVVKEI